MARRRRATIVGRQPVLRIETDKTETDVEAAATGRLHRVGQVGDTFACGERIGWFLADGEERTGFGRSHRRGPGRSSSRCPTSTTPAAPAAPPVVDTGRVDHVTADQAARSRAQHRPANGARHRAWWPHRRRRPRRSADDGTSGVGTTGERPARRPTTVAGGGAAATVAARASPTCSVSTSPQVPIDPIDGNASPRTRLPTSSASLTPQPGATRGPGITCASPASCDAATDRTRSG